MSTSKDPQEPTSSGSGDLPFGSTSDASGAEAADDLSEFSTFRRSAGNMPVVAVLTVAVLFSSAVLWWVFLR